MSEYRSTSNLVMPGWFEGRLSDLLLRCRRAVDYVYLQLTPVRIQARWSAAELAHPTIMRQGRWLAS